MVDTLYPIQFDGGPYDGVIAFLSQPFKELLQPRGVDASKPLSPGEAEFNVSLTGRPYSPGVTYERYLHTGVMIIRSIDLQNGNRIDGAHVMRYAYQGVVGGDDQEGRRDGVTLL